MSSINYVLENVILEKHLRLLAKTQLQNADLSKRTLINFRCPICGDSKKSKYKRRGYFKLRDNSKYGHKTWQFYCHNCFASMLAPIFLKKLYPLSYRDYIRDLLLINDDKITDDEDTLQKETEEIDRKEQIKIKQEELDAVSYFEPILTGTGKLFDDARKLCEDRLIDHNIWSKWYVASNGKFKNRLIIPFFDSNDEIYYWQGRSVYGNMSPKYLNRVENRNEAIYNFFTIDKSKPIVVLEGPINSTFVENSIATLGLAIPEEVQKELNRLQCYYLFDNDKVGKEKSLEYLKQGRYVFLWNKFLQKYKVKSKDINELILVDTKFKDLMNFSALKNYFTNNIIDKFYLV